MATGEMQVNFSAMSKAMDDLGRAFRNLHDVLALESIRALERAGVLIPADSTTQRGMDWSQPGPQTKRLAKMRRRQLRRR